MAGFSEHRIRQTWRRILSGSEARGNITSRTFRLRFRGASGDSFDVKTFAVALVFLMLACAEAGVLVNNGPFSPETFEQPTSTAQLQAADSFTISNCVAIREVRFFGLYESDPVSDDFVVRIFSDTNGAPALPLAEVAMLKSRRHFWREVIHDAEPAPLVFRFYRYRIRLPKDEIQLAPGKYWVSIVNDTHGAGRWGIGAKLPGTGDLHFRETTGMFQNWFDSVPGYGIAFELRGRWLHHCPQEAIPKN
jgi:hypothetical protein